MDKNNLATLQSGGNNIRTLENFTKLCQAEFTVKHNAMVERYKDEKTTLQLNMERKVDEYKFINSVIQLNTELLAATKNGTSPNPASIMAVEKELAQLNYENIGASFPLDYWRTQYGEGMIVGIIADVMNYFLQQFQVKEKLSDIQIMQIALKLLAEQPLLRMRELVFVLNNALQGTYGPTYQRIGIDTILGWLSQFYDHSSGELESRRMNSRADESRGSTPWEVVERNMKKYEEEQRSKKLIVDKVWGIEKRQRQIDDYKESIGATKEKA